MATALVALLMGGTPTAADWSWGAAAGLGVGAGTAFLYRGLTTGRMGVVAPISAVGSALVPVAVALIAGERPGPPATLGIVVALPAIWLIASMPATELTDAPAPRGMTGVVDGALGGLGFGAAFTCLDFIEPAAELIPLVATQTVSLLPVVLLAVWTKEQVWPRTRNDWHGALLGPIGTTANACLLWAVQAGLLSVVAVLVSLYPAVTVALAAIVLRERIHRAQGWGLVLAAVAVGLISQA